jgi:ATP-dependent helicase/nuclease subunit B
VTGDTQPTPDAPRLHVLSWRSPLPAQAAAWLADEAGWTRRGPLDLADRLVVVATRQSGRRLREALARLAATHGQAVFPPRVVLPEQVLALEPAENTERIASKHVSLLAWIEVLLAMRDGELTEVFPVAPPARSFAWASRLGHQLLDVQAKLAEQGLRMADVARSSGGPFPESTRWIQLGELEARYERTLARVGHVDAHVARLRAADEAPPPAGIAAVVLLVVPDPYALTLRALGRWCTRLPVVVVVHADPEQDVATGFDAWGRPRVDHWRRHVLALPDFESRVHLRADPHRQASTIAESIAAAHALAADPLRLGAAVAVGLGDPAVTAPLRAELAARGLTAHSPEGIPRRREALHHLLRTIAAVARDSSFAGVASLVRCPDVLRWLRPPDAAEGPASVLERIDALNTRHLPADLATALQHARTYPNRFPGLELDLERLRALVELASGDDFRTAARAPLAELFADTRFDLADEADEHTVDAIRTWTDTCDAVADAAVAFPRVASADLWELALHAFGETVRFETRPPAAIEIQGWLELPWEDAPHLLVGGLNDGIVPAAITSDPFLPESLRERLGLPTNATRLARDSWLLQALVSARSIHGRCDLLLGRTSTAGDPLRPSRLLLACSDEELPRRVRFLFRELPATGADLPWRRAWRLRPRTPLQRLERMPVTGFRTHLACPFRFYLRHVLRMEPVDPRKNELDARDFGTLVHHAVEELGKDESMRACTEAPALAEYLVARLEEQVRRFHGTNLPLPLVVQVESARQRLQHAARVEAALRSEGWWTEHVEHSLEFLVGPLLVRAKVDRIDRHAETGAWRIVDYKTSDTPVSPAEAHVRPLKKTEDPESLPAYSLFHDGAATRVWKDLQLPLYLHALQAAGVVDATAVCGYFNLPKAVGDTSLLLWEDYTPELREAAWTCALGVADAVAHGVFWPPEESPKFDDFESLFHLGTAASVDWPIATAPEGDSVR